MQRLNAMSNSVREPLKVLGLVESNILAWLSSLLMSTAVPMALCWSRKTIIKRSSIVKSCPWVENEQRRMQTQTQPD